MPRELRRARSLHWLSGTKDRLIVVEFVDELRVVQQWINTIHFRLTLVGKECHNQGVSRSHHGIHHETLTGWNVLGHVCVTDFEESQLLGTSLLEGPVVG